MDSNYSIMSTSLASCQLCYVGFPRDDLLDCCTSVCASCFAGNIKSAIKDNFGYAVVRALRCPYCECSPSQLKGVFAKLSPSMKRLIALSLEKNIKILTYGTPLEDVPAAKLYNFECFSEANKVEAPMVAASAAGTENDTDAAAALASVPAAPVVVADLDREEILPFIEKLEASMTIYLVPCSHCGEEFEPASTEMAYSVSNTPHGSASRSRSDSNAVAADVPTSVADNSADAPSTDSGSVDLIEVFRSKGIIRLLEERLLVRRSLKQSEYLYNGCICPYCQGETCRSCLLPFDENHANITCTENLKRMINEKRLPSTFNFKTKNLHNYFNVQEVDENLLNTDEDAQIIFAEIKERLETMQHEEQQCCEEALKPCPLCGVMIEKNEGCTHHVCVFCGLNYCWECTYDGSDGSGVHYLHGDVCYQHGVALEFPSIDDIF